MKTLYYTAASLDGFIADEDGALDWLFQFGEPEEGYFEHFLSTVGAIAMGAATYEWILEHHIDPGADRPQPWPYAQPTWVFTSRKLPKASGADVRFVRGDVGPVHREMLKKAGAKNIWIVGGGDLAGQFHDKGLLDGVIISVAAVVLGGGAPLLPRNITQPPLRLVSAKTFRNGFVDLHYEVPKTHEA